MIYECQCHSYPSIWTLFLITRYGSLRLATASLIRRIETIHLLFSILSNVIKYGAIHQGKTFAGSPQYDHFSSSETYPKYHWLPCHTTFNFVQFAAEGFYVDSPSFPCSQKHQS